MLSRLFGKKKPDRVEARHTVAEYINGLCYSIVTTLKEQQIPSFIGMEIFANEDGYIAHDGKQKINIQLNPAFHLSDEDYKEFKEKMEKINTPLNLNELVDKDMEEIQKRLAAERAAKGMGV